jgi:hypothetical protein
MFRFVALQLLKHYYKESRPLLTGFTLSRATILVALQTRSSKRALSLVILRVYPSVWIERRDSTRNIFMNFFSPGSFQKHSDFTERGVKTTHTLHEDLFIF